MATRTLYLVRHGHADAWGNLTELGRRQSTLLGERLTAVPVTAVWHSPLPRASDCAQIIGSRCRTVTAQEANELVDHVPYVPAAERRTGSWRGFFDGYDDAEATAGRRQAHALTERFAREVDGDTPAHEVLVTHAYPIAWLIREALSAPAEVWMSLTSLANASLSIIEFSEQEPPAVVLVNDLSHLPGELRWTGFREPRP